jgi:hypothetical protein
MIVPSTAAWRMRECPNPKPNPNPNPNPNTVLTRQCLLQSPRTSFPPCHHCLLSLESHWDLCYMDCTASGSSLFDTCSMTIYVL